MNEDIRSNGRDGNEPAAVSSFHCLGCLLASSTVRWIFLRDPILSMTKQVVWCKSWFSICNPRVPEKLI